MASDARTLEAYALRPEMPRSARIRRAVSDFIKHKPLGAFGAAVVILLIAMAIVPGIFTTLDPTKSSIADRYLGPSAAHWFGTDQQGRDVYTRIIYGARNSIIIGFGVVMISSSVALCLGVISGYFGGWFDTIIQRVVDIGIALPGLIFIILVVTSLQQIPVNLRIMLAVGSLSALSSSRVIRGASISAKQNQYVEAARVIGASDLRIIFRHVTPNVVPVLIIGASIQVGGAVLVESSLSFLGYGVQPPTPSWGRMLNEARERLVQQPHLAIFPGLVIFFTVYSFNMLGDALRDVLDPRMRGSR
ncbi:MAG TPA: ABC transporter permease [Tepidiformaceae bacterium]|nr:ABC transporter permease [Tepidiformaceae bacterium]